MEDKTHLQYMAQALQLAARGLYTTEPNPRVGCVIVKGGKVVGEGWHQWAGEPHAEIHALQQAGRRAKGATAYVTLEPCSHHGKTPPCADALIEAGVKQVVVAMQDPNPLVAGEGLAKLREAGIEVICGVLEAEARQLNPGFIKRMESGRPYVRCKMAMSLDGRTAMASGESQWITGPAARTDVQRLRARSSAIVAGVDTIIYDDSALTIRAEQLQLPEAERIVQRQPLRVIVDSHLRIPPHAKVLRQPGETVIITCERNHPRQAELEAQGITVQPLATTAIGQVDLGALLDYLGERECNEVLLETGATLAGGFVKAGLLDELTLYMAPTLLGHSARALFNIPGMRYMADQYPLEIDEIRAVGRDWRITARFRHGDTP